MTHQDFLLQADEIPGGIIRRIFTYTVEFLPRELIKLIKTMEVAAWDYSVCKFPFVPGFHVCYLEATQDFGATQETIVSTHKTLHEAMGVCRLLLFNGGITYV